MSTGSRWPAGAGACRSWSPATTDHPHVACCRLCQVTYTHILHYETLAGDWRQLLEDLSLDTAELQLPWENKGGGGGELREYFGLIADQQQMLLYGKYEADFKLFGYSLDDDF